MIDVAIAIDMEARTCSYLPGEGKNGHWDADGRWNSAPRAFIPIVGAAMPSRGQELRDLPEGIRDEARWVFYTRAAIDTDGIIMIDGQEYRILFLWTRTFDGNYRKAAMGLTK